MAKLHDKDPLGHVTRQYLYLDSKRIMPARLRIQSYQLRVSKVINSNVNIFNLRFGISDSKKTCCQLFFVVSVDKFDGTSLLSLTTAVVLRMYREAR